MAKTEERLALEALWDLLDAHYNPNKFFPETPPMLKLIEFISKQVCNENDDLYFMQESLYRSCATIDMFVSRIKEASNGKE